MSDEVKFKWDKDKHDAEIPDKPKQEGVFCPKCGGQHFQAGMKLIRTILPNKMMAISPEKPDVAFCMGCGELYTMEKLIREGKRPNKPIAVGPPPKTQA